MPKSSLKIDLCCFGILPVPAFFRLFHISASAFRAFRKVFLTRTCSCSTASFSSNSASSLSISASNTGSSNHSSCRTRTRYRSQNRSFGHPCQGRILRLYLSMRLDKWRKWMSSFPSNSSSTVSGGCNGKQRAYSGISCSMRA